MPVQGLMDRDYASYDDVPYHSRWRHFEAGGLDRTARLKTAWDGSKSCDGLGGLSYLSRAHAFCFFQFRFFPGPRLKLFSFLSESF